VVAVYSLCQQEPGVRQTADQCYHCSLVMRAGRVERYIGRSGDRHGNRKCDRARSPIVVSDEHRRTLFSKARGNGPNDGLISFTGSTVTG
jgi:hypothetical protein